MDWAEKIRNIELSLGISTAELARKIEVEPRYLHELKSGKTKNPGAAFLTKLTKIGLSANWLLTGEGEMFLTGRDPKEKDDMKTDTASDLVTSVTKNDTVSDFVTTVTEQESQLQPPTSGKSPLSLFPSLGGEIADPREIVVYRFLRGKPVPVEVREPDPEGAVLLPLFSQPTAAGPGQPPNQLQETERSVPVLYTLLGARRPENCALVRVSGDSMADIGLFNGDYVLFDQSDRSGDGIFVISLFGETRVKRLQYRLADQKILIASENAKRYPEPEVVPMSYVQEGNLIIHGRVFAWLHRHPY